MGYMGHWIEIFKDKNVHVQTDKDLIPIVESNFVQGLNHGNTSKFMTQNGKLAILTHNNNKNNTMSRPMSALSQQK